MKEYKIDLIKIGETYIKFDFEFTKSNQNLIREAYLRQVGYSSREVLKNKELFKISIEYEKGSLKTRIVIWGTALYMGIANYGSFRAGVKEIVNDVNTFSSFVINRIDDDPAINTNNTIRTEKRTGFPGRIQELYNRIDKLERNINILSNNGIQAEILWIKQEVVNIYTVLPNHDKQAFLNDINDDYCQNLPAPIESRTDYLANRYGLKPDEEIEFVEE